MSRSKAGLSYLLLVAVTIVTLYPILWVVGLALGDGLPRGGVNPFPADPSLEPVIGLLQNPAFTTALWNSLVISIAASCVGVGLAASAGYALSRFAFFGADATLIGIILSQMFPGVVSSIPIYYLLHKASLLDTRSGLILVYATSSVPFCAYALKGWFDTLPKISSMRRESTARATSRSSGRLRCPWRALRSPSPSCSPLWAPGPSLS